MAKRHVRPSPLLPKVLGNDGGHFIGCLNDLGIHFVGALRRNEIGDFLDGIHVGSFEIPLLDVSEARIIRHADNGRTRRGGFAEQVVTERLEAGLVDEVGERQLAKILHFGIIADAGKDLTGAGDDDFAGFLGKDDPGNHGVAVEGHELTLGIGVEGAGAGVVGFPVRIFDLEPAPADQREVKLVRGSHEAALDVKVAHGRRLNAETDMRALGNDRLVGGVRDALIALDLVEKVREFSAGALETRRVDVRHVVGDHLKIELLCVHAGCGDGQSLHGEFLRFAYARFRGRRSPSCRGWRQRFAVTARRS